MKVNIQEYLLDNLFDGVYYVNTKRIIRYWNKSAEEITGYKREEVIGKACFNNILKHIDANGKELCKTKCPVYESMQKGRTIDTEVFLHHKKGYRVPISVRVSPVKDEKGNIIGAVEIFNSKSDRADFIRHLEKIKNETFIDPISKTGNRKYAQFHLNNRFIDIKLHKILFGVLFIHIDNFQKIIDDHDSDVANSVLEMVAKSTKNGLKNIDVVARWNEQQFIVILPNIKELEVVTASTKQIQKFIEHSWLHIENKTIQVTVSIGGTLSKQNDKIELIVERAEKMLNKAIEAGGNAYFIGV